MNPSEIKTSIKIQDAAHTAALTRAHPLQGLSGASAVSTVFLFLYFLIQPLLLHHGYFDITETKQAYFLLLGASYPICMAIMKGWNCLFWPKQAKAPAFWKGFHPSDWLMLAFFAAFFLSALLSPYPIQAWMAPENRYQGLFTVFLYAALWVCLSKNPGVEKLFEWTLAGGFCVVCLFTALQALGLDPLALRAPLSPGDRMRYVSTMGNINFYSSYLCLLLPFVLTKWCFAQGCSRYLYGLCLIFGAWGALFSGSDSFVLGLLAVCMLLPLFLLAYPNALRRFFDGLLLLFATMQLIYLTVGLHQSPLYVSYWLQLLLKPVPFVVLLAVCGAFSLLLRPPRQPLIRFQKPYLWTLVSLILAAVLLLVAANTLFASHSFGPADRYLKFNAHWGTDRGRVWQFCIRQFAGFDPLHQIFGGGPGCLYFLDAGHSVFSDAALDSAHNELLHYLITTGFVGLACYMGLLVCVCLSVVKTIRKGISPAFLCPLLMGVFGYLAQSLVNIAQPFSTPYLFLFLALLKSHIAQPNNPQ